MEDDDSPQPFTREQMAGTLVVQGLTAANQHKQMCAFRVESPNLEGDLVRRLKEDFERSGLVRLAGSRDGSPERPPQRAFSGEPGLSC